jgi:hypothetical protein
LRPAWAELAQDSIWKTQKQWGCGEALNSISSTEKSLCFYMYKIPVNAQEVRKENYILEGKSIDITTCLQVCFLYQVHVSCALKNNFKMEK